MPRPAKVNGCWSWRTHKVADYKVCAGEVSTQSILGMMYAAGAGVPNNPQKAQKWLYAAAGKGDDHAIRMLDLLGRDAGALRL